MNRSEKKPRNGEAAPWPRRLDTVAAQAGGVSRRAAQRLIADGAVTLNGRTAAAGDKGRMIGPEDVVIVSADAGQVVPQPDVPLVELASGPGWVAVDKPAGVAVHPLREGETGTLLNAVAARYPQVQGVGAVGGEGGLRSGVVHRLDVATSGALLIALDETTWQRFRSAFSAHRARKTYWAVVDGPIEARGQAELYLLVTRHRPARVEVVDPMRRGARRCDLSWRVEQSGPLASVVAIELGTGFLHQIRAIFAHLGHPVLGDSTYSTRELAESAPRLMLHARRLRIEEIDVTSPLPTAFEGFIKAPS